MRNIELRPDLKTMGGEVSDILVGGRYAGNLTMVYREGDRISGAVQLEKESLKPADKERLVSFLQNYVQSYIHAVRAKQCDVIVTYSDYDRVVTTAAPAEFAREAPEPPARNRRPDNRRRDRRRKEQEPPSAMEWAEAEYELVIVDERRNRTAYHVYDEEGNWAAEAFLKTDDSAVTGRVRWVSRPADEEIELITELIVSDFDEKRIDTFVIDHEYKGNVLETVELTHEDLLETPVEIVGEDTEDRYHVLLARDDGDVLTYEIYNQEAGGPPIGTATIDIEHRRLTGYIDFRNRRSAKDAEAITTLLLRELDKEKDYDGLNLSLMHNNEKIDEVVIENEAVH